MLYAALVLDTGVCNIAGAELIVHSFVQHWELVKITMSLMEVIKY